MKYEVLYDTQIANEYRAKGEIIEFPNGTDEGYILSLVRNKVIEETQEEQVQDKVVEKVIEETQDDEVKKGKKASKSGK